MYETSSQAVAAVRKLIRGVQNATQISENDLIRIHVILIGHESPIQIIEEALQGLK